MPAPKLDESEINKLVGLLEKDSQQPQADKESNTLTSAKLLQIRDWRKRHPKA